MISLICVAVVMQAQSNQPYLIQYKNGDKTLIYIPSSSKIVKNKDYLEINPYNYTLRLQNHNVKKQGFVTPQYVADSLTAKIVRVNCDYEKVTLSNPQNQGYSMIYDNRFHQIDCFPPESDAQNLEFVVSDQKPGFYWLSNGKSLVGIDSNKK